MVTDYDVKVDLRNRVREPGKPPFDLSLAHLDGSQAPIDVAGMRRTTAGPPGRPATVPGDRVTLLPRRRLRLAQGARGRRRRLGAGSAVIRAWYVR